MLTFRSFSQRRRTVVESASLALAKVVLSGVLAGAATYPAKAKPQDPTGAMVTTYHYNANRTGWNNAEITLNTSNVAASSSASASFNLLTSVALDEQADAQPLLMPGQNVSGQGTHDTLYVATENNTVYAIDAGSGQILLSRNLGSPLPQSALPGQCNNNSAVVGINSTPVIDPASGTLYLIAHTYENNQPVFRLHALDLGSLADKVSPPAVTASHPLQDGSVYTFMPQVSRQRSALLLANGNVYAGFASFCDIDASLSRGWLLGWSANSLQPLAANELNNLLASSQNDFFLSSIWMSGFGVAADPSGALYFSTGNSDPGGKSYSPALNLSESVIKMSPGLSSVQSFFTPANVGALDEDDLDVSSAGVMVLPNQPGKIKTLVVAGSKAGQMYLLNAMNLGGHTPGGPDKILGSYATGQCWCGPSYFQGADGVGRVVSSGGIYGAGVSPGGGTVTENDIIVWRLQEGSTASLVQEWKTALPPTSQDPGSFTTISSNGKQAGTGIIWTVGRPQPGDSTHQVTLYALDASSGAILRALPAGTWPHLSGNANIVPVVANGHVYVASYKQLAIFGIGSAGAAITSPAASTTPVQGHRVFGTIESGSTNEFVLQTRTGQAVTVDASGAFQNHQSVPLVVGENVEVRGSYASSGALQASVILHAKSPASWEPDQ